MRVFPGVWMCVLRLPSQDRSLSLPLLSHFYLLYFFLPPFEDNGLPFWVPNVLCQHSEVGLWNLLSVQIFFRWICVGESGLPVLFLCHLRTTSLFCISNISLSSFQNIIFSFHNLSFFLQLVSLKCLNIPILTPFHSVLLSLNTWVWIFFLLCQL